MVSYENGILKLNSGRDHGIVGILKDIYCLLFIINIAIIYLFASVKLVASLAAVCLFATSLLILLFSQRKFFVVPFNSIWYLIVTVYCALSTLWSTYYYSGITGLLLKMLVVCMIITSISIFVEKEEDLDRLLTMFIIAVLFICVFEIIITPTEKLTTGLLGGNRVGNNSNSISFWVACAEMMAFYKAYIKNKKSYYFLVLFFLIFILLSSSRKSVFLSITAPIGILALETSKKNYWLRIIGIFVLATLVIFLIFTNEVLYEIVGNRIQTLLNFMTSSGETDTSVYLRTYFVSVAKKMFISSPILGRGFGNFSFMLMENPSSEFYYFGGTYVHNNYWQILSELGMAGFLIYYSMYAYIIFKLIRRVFVERDRLSYLFLVFVILLSISEVGMVTLYSKHSHFVLALAYTSTYAKNSNQITMN